MEQTLILGIGNSLLRDEGLGIHLLDYLRKHHGDEADVTYLDGGTLSFTLAPDIENCKNLIVLDVAQFNEAPATVKLLIGAEMDHFVGRGKRSVHEVGLVDLMSIARLQDCLPQNRALLGIQPAELGWGDMPSDAVAAVIPEAARRVVELIHQWHALEHT